MNSSNTTISASAQSMRPRARTFTIKELTSLISTETSKEFGWSQEEAATAENLWQQATSFEWDKASKAGSSPASSRKYPYLICHAGEGMSGYQRTLALREAIDSSSIGGEGEVHHLRHVYNADDYLCVYGQLLATVAAGVDGDDIVVQPLVPSLKFMLGSVDRIYKEVDSYNNNDNKNWSPTLDVVLCPGVAMVAKESNTSSIGELTTNMEEEILEMLAREATISAESPSSSSATTVAEEEELTILSETYYLISQAYINSTQGVGEGATARAKLWKDLMEDFQQNGQCSDAYSSREGVRWTTLRARDDPKMDDLSSIRIEFNATASGESGPEIVDAGCMLILSLAVAVHPDVCSVEVRERVSTKNAIVQWLTQAEIEDERPFFDAGLDGSGQYVAVSDTGCDQDHCYFVNSPGVQAGVLSPNPSARKLVQYFPYVDNRDFTYGHGTHVSGTIAGNRLDNKGAARGVAPGAKLAICDIGDSLGNLDLPADRVLLNTGRPHAKIHSASWGSELNFYSLQARNFDQYMYENDDFLIVLAAGNGGQGNTPGSLASPATAKNTIAVGAHHNVGTSLPQRALGPNYIADFSSRGPTSDGRTKPDLLAPGKAVLSAGALPAVVGECDPSDGDVPGPNSHDDGLLSLQGTSMATPVVSGTAALIRQYFEQGYYPTGLKNDANIFENPSGALIKAVLMNGAQFMAGVDNGPKGVTSIEPYDNTQNFGRLSLQDSLYLPGKTNVQLKVWDKEYVNDQGSQSYIVTIDKSNGCAHETLSVTLVWVEQGSVPGCTHCLLNDLDVTVSLGTRTFYPNNLGQPDRNNNAERVIVNVENGAEAVIIVSGHNLIRRKQQFSLVVSGCLGGVANQMFVGQCSAFDCDDSKEDRIQTILMAIFIPLGVILFCFSVLACWKRRNLIDQQAFGDNSNRFVNSDVKTILCIVTISVHHL